MRKKMKNILLCILLVGIGAVSAINIYLYTNARSYRVESYISDIEKVNHEEYDINWDNAANEYNIIFDKDEFKVMQLTDIHIGGTKKTQKEDLKAFQAMYKLVKYAKPDLIVITGDLVYSKLAKTHSPDNMNSFIMICNFFEKIGIPWTFTFGNHDTEEFAMAKPEDFISTTQAYVKCLYQYNDPLGGRTNLFINIRNKDNKIVQSLVLMDSGEYVEGEGYDAISEAQIQWYEDRIKELSKEQGETISSMLFFHIPLYEWDKIYEKYMAHSTDVKYYYGGIGEEICNTQKKNTLLEKIFELNSTKAIFVGHDHLNDLSLEYKGVRFTYGKSIDYLAYCKKTEYQRGATLITIKNDSEFEISPIVLAEIK